MMLPHPYDLNYVTHVQWALLLHVFMYTDSAEHGHTITSQQIDHVDHVNNLDRDHSDV